MKEKTDVITIRIPQSMKLQLLQMAEKKNISLNTMLRHVLEQYLTWTEPSSHLGWMNIFRHALIEILEQVDEKEIIEIAKTTSANEFKTSLLYMFDEISFENSKRLFELWLESIGIKFLTIHKPNVIKYKIQHDLGTNWPVFVVKTLEVIFSELEVEMKNAKFAKRSFSFEIHYKK